VSRDVLEHNLARLLRRSYRPATPAADFRRRLTERLRAELGPRPLRAAPAWRARTWRAAAAVLLVALGALAWRLALGPRAGTALEELLARGLPALRLGDEAWRAWSDGERARGLEHGTGALGLANTVDGETLQVLLAGPGALELGADGRAQLAAAASGALDLEFTQGALTLERLARGAPWIVATAQGEFELERGRLALAYVGPEIAQGGRSLRAELLHGVAWLRRAGERTALVAGSAELVRGGRTFTLDGRERPALREPGVAHGADGADGAAGAGGAGGEAGAAPSTEPAPAEEPATLRVEVRWPRGLTPQGTLTLTALRRERLPDVSTPRTFRCDAAAPECVLAGLPPGVYEVFASLPGCADWQAADLLLAAGEQLTLVIEPAQPALLSGRVLDEATRQPIAGAWVVSEQDAPTQVLPYDFAQFDEQDGDPLSWRALTRTGPDGRFELRALSPGRQLLRASAAGHGAAWSGRLELAPGEIAAPIELLLPAPGRLTGTLADGADALLIASRIDIEGARRRISYGMAQCDDSGRFALEDLAAGLYVVIRVEEGRAHPGMRQVYVRGGVTTELDLGPEARGARLSGRLRSADGRPGAGLDISLQPLEEGGPRGPATWVNERCDGEGRFVFEALAPGNYTVFVGRELGSVFVEQRTLEVVAGLDQQLELELPTGTLRGRVRRAADGTALPEADVILLREVAGELEFAGRTQSDARGDWTLEHVPPGRLRVVAQHTAQGLAPASSELLVLGGGSDSPPAFDLALQRGADLALRLVDTQGRPVGRATLALESGGRALYRHGPPDETGADGRLRLRGLTPGTWKLRLAREGFAPLVHTLLLEVGENPEQQLVLARP